MHRFPAFALPLLSLILISGCTAPAGGPGVAIETFQPDFRSVFSGEEVDFLIKVRNTGSVDSGPGDVRVLGLEEWFPVSGTCTFTKLLAPLEGTTGEAKACPAFAFTAPPVPRGIPVTYTPTARLTYSYASALVKSLTIGTQEELRRVENQGVPLPLETTFSSPGPISISVASPGPLRVFGPSITFPLEITVSNTGGGVVCSPDCTDQQGWNRLTISAFLGSDPITPCTRLLTLPRGQSNILTCEVQVQKPEPDIVQKIIRIESTYDYFIDSTASVTVNWAPT